MDDSTFRIRVGVPLQIAIESRRLDRDHFFAWVWRRFSELGLLGVHEGTVLSEQIEPWTVDSGEAPRSRDWIAISRLAEAEFYFSTRKGAETALGELRDIAGLSCSEVEEQLAQDWDAQWKAAFLSSPTGVVVPPFWRIVPPWLPAESTQPGEEILRINPGAGFGTGTHETTQLCLSAIAGARLTDRSATWRVLDFGSGSGILSAAAALLGASVEGIEIDPLAIDNAEENARLNVVVGRIRFSRTLEGVNGPFDLVVANILRPVLMEFAEELVARMASNGGLVLSGLIEADVDIVRARYSALLAGKEPEVQALAEWRALIWKAPA